MAGIEIERTAWLRYPHDADIGVRGYGRDAAEAFANVARAMTDAVTPLEGIFTDQIITVTCRAADLEILLVDWLNAVIYEMATRRMLFRDFDVSFDGETLHATLAGEPVDVARHAPAVEPKGATLTDLSVTRIDDGRWSAQCVVDV